MGIIRAVIAASLLFGAAASMAEASLITMSPGGTTVVDFSQFSGLFAYGPGPVQVGGLVGEDIVFSSTSGGAVIGSDGYGLGENGYWDSGRVGYVGLNNTYSAGDYVEFQFNSGPVSTVGGFVNYAICEDSQCYPAQSYEIAVFGVGNVLLESYNVSTLAPISTPGQIDAGAFRGITRPSDDIVALRLYNAVNVIDDLEFARQTSPVPEPTSLALFGLGLGVTGLLRRRRSKR
jgi:hypothetical protein